MSKKTKQNWHGIMKILEVTHSDLQGNVLWKSENIYNKLHLDGEEYLLRAAFTGGQLSTVIPENYYLGLDNRQSVQLTNTMDNLVGEPSGNGYFRQEVSSSGDFSINFENNHFIATSPIVAFRATSGSWGPVSNLFLTNNPDNSGFLISTATLDSAITVNAGDSVTMRIGMQLKNCD